jgi:pyruvate dehydrogenase E1 component beta subunit
MREVTYARAINEALREEMRRDEKVFLLGEDIGVLGGVFSITKGLLEEFGPERVRDTPISENAIIGAALGASLLGFHPVAEIMYWDFFNECGDQLVNHLPKIHFMSGGKLKAPVTVRTQYSLGRYTGAQHSQFSPAFYMNTPGLIIALPSTPYDAKGLLKTAIRGDNPTIFAECPLLYKMEGQVPEEDYTVPFGKAEIRTDGKDVTLFAVSVMVPKALTAAETLKKEGIGVTVIDPKTLSPLDKDCLIDSVKKTGRLVIAEPDCKTAGIGAEISAIVAEEVVAYLDSPVIRVASPDLPAPFSQPLSDRYIPSHEEIVKAVRKTIS